MSEDQAGKGDIRKMLGVILPRRKSTSNRQGKADGLKPHGKTLERQQSVVEEEWTEVHEEITRVEEEKHGFRVRIRKLIGWKWRRTHSLEELQIQTLSEENLSALQKEIDRVEGQKHGFRSSFKSSLRRKNKNFSATLPPRSHNKSSCEATTKHTIILPSPSHGSHSNTPTAKIVRCTPQSPTSSEEGRRDWSYPKRLEEETGDGENYKEEKKKRKPSFLKRVFSKKEKDHKGVSIKDSKLNTESLHAATDVNENREKNAAADFLDGITLKMEKKHQSSFKFVHHQMTCDDFSLKNASSKNNSMDIGKIEESGCDQLRDPKSSIQEIVQLLEEQAQEFNKRLPPHTFSVSSLQNFVAIVSSALSTESLPLAKITQNGLEHSPVPPSFASRRRGSLPFFPHPSSSHLLVPSKSPQITSVLPRELSSASINVSHNSSCIFTFESDVD